jgi:hypothetical protein
MGMVQINENTFDLQVWVTCQVLIKRNSIEKKLEKRNVSLKTIKHNL